MSENTSKYKIRRQCVDEMYELGELFVFAKMAVENGMFKDADEAITKFSEGLSKDIGRLLPRMIADKTVLIVGSDYERFFSSRDILYPSSLPPAVIRYMKPEIIDNQNLDKLPVNIVNDINSFDIILTNRLLMYFTDGECINFLMDCLKLLRKDGLLIINEPCEKLNLEYKAEINKLLDESEKSLIDINIRWSSVYIKIFESIECFIPEKMELYKFQVIHCSPMSSYVNFGNTFKRIQFKLKKIVTNTCIEDMPSTDCLKRNISECFTTDQIIVNSICDINRNYFADNLISHFYKRFYESERTNLAHVIFQCRREEWYFRVNPFSIHTNKNDFVWVNETCSEFFNSFLDNAKKKGTRKLKLSYSNNSINDLIESVKEADFKVKSFFSINLLDEHSLEFFSKLRCISTKNAVFCLLESYSSIEEGRRKGNELRRISNTYLSNDVSEKICEEAMKLSLTNSELNYFLKRRWHLMSVFMNGPE
uniref:phosphoethanolamine N-methyltransferase n=1 Tax=Parastrongyloides trichosuri TaxID=131310 RepID=A0A0N4ZCF3_PARTI